MSRSIHERIAKLEQQIEQHRQRMRDAKAQAVKQARRDETRKKIIFGAAYLTALDKLPAQEAEQMRAHVHRHIGRPKDREFLGLAPLKADLRDASPKPLPKIKPAAEAANGTPLLPFGEAEGK